MTLGLLDPHSNQLSYDGCNMSSESSFCAKKSANWLNFIGRHWKIESYSELGTFVILMLASGKSQGLNLQAQLRFWIAYRDAVSGAK